MSPPRKPVNKIQKQRRRRAAKKRQTRKDPKATDSEFAVSEMGLPEDEAPKEETNTHHLSTTELIQATPEEQPVYRLKDLVEVIMDREIFDRKMLTLLKLLDKRQEEIDWLKTYALDQNNGQ